MFRPASLGGSRGWSGCATIGLLLHSPASMATAHADSRQSTLFRAHMLASQLQRFDMSELSFLDLQYSSSTSNPACLLWSSELAFSHARAFILVCAQPYSVSAPGSLPETGDTRGGN